MKFLVLTLFCLMFVSAAYADGKQSSLALPDVQSMPIESFVSQSDKIEKEYGRDDPYIAFEVQLPKSFLERDFSTLKHYQDDGRLYGELYRKDGPALEDVRAYFSLQSHRLSRMISPKNWFITRLMENGGTLRGFESSRKGNSFEALYVRFDDLGRTEIVRAKGELKGDRVIMAEYVLPPLMWEDERDLQTFAIKSFELKGHIDNKTAENLLSYVYLETFSMRYPESWRQDKNVNVTENQIDLSFLAADEMRFPFAHIDLTLIADQSLKDPIDRSRYPTNLPNLIQERKAKISDQGFLFGDVIEKRTYDLNFEPLLQVTEVYPLRKKLTDYVTHRRAPVSREFWITVIKGTEETGKNYIVTMLAPSRIGSSPKDWALAVKAYEVMIESIR